MKSRHERKHKSGRDLTERTCGLFQLSDQGFTLLELMLATVILAMVVSMITVSLSGSMNVVESTRDQGDIYYRAQVALQRISEDLESAVLTEDVDFIAPVPGPMDQEQRLVRFTSMAHLVFNPDYDQEGMGAIGYLLMPDPEDEEQLVLLRSDALVRPREENTVEDTGKGFLLCDRLRSVTFMYFDAAGEEHDSWDTRTEPGMDIEEIEVKRRLPAAVSCRLEFWLDREKETTLVFQTSVAIPVGMITPETKKGNV